MGKKSSTQTTTVHANLLFRFYLVADREYWEQFGAYPVTLVLTWTN